MDEDKRQAALNEAAIWAKQIGATIEHHQGKYTLIRSGEILYQGNPWQIRDAAYAMAPYAQGGELSERQKPTNAIPQQKEASRQFLQQAIAELEPTSEHEFLLAVVDHPLGDFGLARHIYRQYEKENHE